MEMAVIMHQLRQQLSDKQQNDSMLYNHHALLIFFLFEKFSNLFVNKLILYIQYYRIWKYIFNFSLLRIRGSFLVKSKVDLFNIIHSVAVDGLETQVISATSAIDSP